MVGVLDLTVDPAREDVVQEVLRRLGPRPGPDARPTPTSSAPRSPTAASTDLGGRRVPLYIVDGTNTLVEATTFASAFTPCEPGTFPKKFQPGKKTKVCLVFLAPEKGDLTAVSFRPTQEFDPITWTGELEAPKPPKPPKGKGKGGQGARATSSPATRPPEP